MQLRFTILGGVAASLLALAGMSPSGAKAQEANIQLAQSDGQPLVISPQAPRPENAPPNQYGSPPPQYGAQGGQYGSEPPQYGSQQYGGVPPPQDDGGPGRPYVPAAPSQANANDRYVPPEAQDQGTFSIGEIKEAGHRFFGTVSIDFAKVVEYSFQKAGRPNGYILGEEAGGAFVAGLRYGEGTLYTKDAGDHHVYWQGPSLGYDFGGDGSKTMVLVYNLQSPDQIYRDYAGIDGSAYLVGGIGVTFLNRDNVILAPIRSGIGLRLGANIGYLKYTREPTWNPF